MSRRWLLQPRNNRRESISFGVAEALAQPSLLDNEGIKRLLEKATSNGFIGQPIEDANKALIKHAAEQRAFV